MDQGPRAHFDISALLPAPLEQTRAPNTITGLYPVLVKDYMTQLSNIMVARLPHAWLIVQTDTQMTLFLNHKTTTPCDSLSSIQRAITWTDKQYMDPRWQLYGGTIWSFCVLLHAWKFVAGRLPTEVNVEELREVLVGREEKRKQEEKEKSCRAAKKASEGETSPVEKCVQHIWIED